MKLCKAFAILAFMFSTIFGYEYSTSIYDNIEVSNEKNIKYLDTIINSFDTDLTLYNVTYLYDSFIYTLNDNQKFLKKMNNMNKKSAAYLIEDSLERDYLNSIIIYFEINRRRTPKKDTKLERCLETIKRRINELDNSIKKLRNKIDIKYLNSIIDENIEENKYRFYEVLNEKDISDLKFATFMYFFDRSYVLYPGNNRLYDNEDYLYVLNFIARRSYGKMGITKNDFKRGKGKMTVADYTKLMSEKIGTIVSTYN